MAVAKKTAPETQNGVAFPPSLLMHRFTVDQYHRMIELGVLTENDGVELLEGWIVDKMPQHPAHAGTISVMLRKVQPLLPRNWIVRVQSPITLEASEPEPDLVVVRGPEERYFTAHPHADDIDGLIEFSDSTLDYDRYVKGRLYAAARIAWYWIVNLAEMKVEVYTQPRLGKKPSYRRREVFGPEQGLPLLINGRNVGVIPVAQLFP